MEKKANWHKAKHGLITKAKISFGLQKYKGELKRIGEGEKRRREKKENKKKKKRREEDKRRKKEEEFKEDSKVWNLKFSMDYLDFLIWIHVLGCKKPNPRMNSCMELRV